MCKLGADNKTAALSQSLYPTGHQALHKEKGICLQRGDLGSKPGAGRSPGEGDSQPLQYSGLNSGERSLLRYTPWGSKELDMTQGLSKKKKLLWK